MFTDVNIGGQKGSCMEIRLFADLVTKAAENLRQFCPGEFRKERVPIGYKVAFSQGHKGCHDSEWRFC